MTISFQEDKSAAAACEGAASLFADLLKGGADLRVKVTGRSMTPFLRAGDILTMRRVDPSFIRTGDLLLFLDSFGGSVIHRTVRKLRTSGEPVFQTKGDASPCCDPPVPAAGILAMVVAVERRRGDRTIILRMDSPLRRAFNRVLAMFSLARGVVVRAACRLKAP